MVTAELRLILVNGEAKEQWLHGKKRKALEQKWPHLGEEISKLPFKWSVAFEEHEWTIKPATRGVNNRV